MKNFNIKIIAIIFILFPIVCYSQIKELVEELQSNDDYRNSIAVYEIIQQNLYEAYPYLLDLYNSKPLQVKIDFLQALSFFNDPDITTKAEQFIVDVDSASQEELKYIDPLFEKVRAVSILFRFNQFNYANLIFDLINRDGVENIRSEPFHLLGEIINKVPLYEIEAKNILLSIYTNGSDYNRYFAMVFLTKKYNSEMVEMLRTSFVNDSDLSIRTRALEYLLQLDKDNFESLLLSQLHTDSSWSFRTMLVDSLLNNYGTPSDLKAVIDYNPTEPNVTAKSLIGYSVQYFIPPRPDIFVFSMIDTLRSYTEQLYQYQWITDSKTYKDYLALLKEQKNESDTLQAAQAYLSNINLLIARVQSDFNFGTVWETGSNTTGSLITAEAYKFMYYYSVYIKEDLQKIINGTTN